MQKNMQDIERKIIPKAFLIGCILSIAVYFFAGSRIALGVLLGTLVSILNFRLLRHSIANLNAGKSQLYSKIYFFLRYLLRYGIIALVLYLAYLKKGMGFFVAVAVGLFTVQLSIFLNIFFIKKHAG